MYNFTLALPCCQIIIIKTYNNMIKTYKLWGFYMFNILTYDCNHYIVLTLTIHAILIYVRVKERHT